MEKEVTQRAEASKTLERHVHPIGSEATMWSKPSQRTSSDCPSLLSHKPLGSHTLWLLYSLKANYTSLRLGTGGGWGQERTRCNFPRIRAPKSGSVTAPARLIVSGRESDEHKNRTTQKGTGSHTKAFRQLPGKLSPVAASNNPGTVQLSAGEGEIIICKNVTNISLCYLT